MRDDISFSSFIFTFRVFLRSPLCRKANRRFGDPPFYLGALGLLSNYATEYPADLHPSSPMIIRMMMFRVIGAYYTIFVCVVRNQVIQNQKIMDS